ncbi:Hypothetical protein NG00_02059 [Corynebacterium camporealensis]|uniref:Uncharacterized protein n=1 Tax=Corynebacterium camporealensis TaxID=161896 RepID=A0A0F6QYN0_9CORY|nr:hypothetical protein [Corynebacterium camporealensis]AKE40240.1 hypothetical protein UL81_11555 [Corynebacterium camporealensis]AVH89297.1 Hypothetical protein NG00_02059 [Corynebacterium camporealensis]MDY5840122.1 hypothetical protein [Corynebacterium camporealensis]
MLEPVKQGSLLHPEAARSVFWETESEVTDPAFEKEAWLSATLLNFGDCGFTIGDEATIFFCRREDAPGAQKLPTAPVSEDAEILSSLFIKSNRAERGLEAVLIDAVLMNLTNRGSTAIEAFGYYGEPREAQDFLGHKPGRIGLLKVEHLKGAGFEVVADHPVLPRLRLELPPAHDLLSAAAVDDVLAKAFA